MNRILTKEFNEAWNKLNEQIELDEAKKELCLISDRAKDFKKVEATILTPEYFAHKNNYSGWVITDKASGLALKFGFRTLADAKDYLKTMPEEELEKINEIKATLQYKEQCAKLAAANIDNYELDEDFCYSIFEALEENGQESLFENINEQAISFNDLKNYINTSATFNQITVFIDNLYWNENNGKKPTAAVRAKWFYNHNLLEKLFYNEVKTNKTTGYFEEIISWLQISDANCTDNLEYLENKSSSNSDFYLITVDKKEELNKIKSEIAELENNVPWFEARDKIIELDRTYKYLTINKNLTGLDIKISYNDITEKWKTHAHDAKYLIVYHYHTKTLELFNVTDLQTPEFSIKREIPGLYPLS